MQKKYYLKKAFLRDTFNAYIIRLFLWTVSFQFKRTDKILVKLTNGIGDILVTDNISEEIVKKYGKENVYFLVQDIYKELGEILGYQVIGLSKKERYNFFYRLKKMYQLNKLGFKKAINLDTTNDTTFANLFIPEIIGCKDFGEMHKQYNKYYTKMFVLEGEKINEIIKNLGEKVLEKKEKNNVVPDLRKKIFTKDEKIVVAVGSTDRTRVCSPKKMIEYLKVVNRKYPNEKIYLIGNGQRQKKYADTLQNLDKNIKFINLIDKTTLKEAFDYVAESKLFIGFESGLYNLCYVLHKKSIVLFKKLNVPFHHDVEWIKILGPDEIKNIEDEEYSGEEINSISVKQFEQNLEMLEIIRSSNEKNIVL
ncbi:MAG: glycosyltransferase family 9 protein [Cetobacterium sp.]